MERDGSSGSSWRIKTNRRAIRNARPFDEGSGRPFRGLEDWRIGAGGGDRGFKQRGLTLKTGFCFFFLNSCSCKLGREVG